MMQAKYMMATVYLHARFQNHNFLCSWPLLSILAWPLVNIIDLSVFFNHVQRKHLEFSYGGLQICYFTDLGSFAFDFSWM